MSPIKDMIEQTSIRYAKKINQIAAPLKEFWGITYFAYQFVSNTGAWFTLGNHPDWMLYSVENEFYHADPTLVFPKNHVFPFFNSTSQNHKDVFRNNIASHALKHFNLDHCLGIVKPNAQGCEYYFFAVPHEHQDILSTYITQFSRLNHDYTRYVREQIRPFYGQLLDCAVDLKKIFSEPFDALDNASSKGQLFSNSLNQSQQLTPRENECLILYQQGFSAKQTAQKLNLSFRSVEDYFEKIKIKLGVDYKRDLLFL
jgi:DNA-binding CsgD family transcriptional regulator